MGQGTEDRGCTPVWSCLLVAAWPGGLLWPTEGSQARGPDGSPLTVAFAPAPPCLSREDTPQGAATAGHGHREKMRTQPARSLGNSANPQARSQKNHVSVHEML